MEQWQREHILEQLNKSIEFKHEFFVFKEEAKVQLVSNQFQYFQTLAAIGFAAAALIVGTNSLKLTIWWFLMGVSAVLLLLFTSSSVRELNDLHANRLETEDEGLEKIHRKLEAASKEALARDDFNIFVERMRPETNAVPEKQSYAGEIAVFLLFLTLTFGLLGAADQFASGLKIYLFAPAAIVSAFLLAFLDWNLYLSDTLSRLLDFVLRKNRPQS